MGMKQKKSPRSQIEGYTFLLIFNKISSLPVFSPTQMKFSPSYPLLISRAYPLIKLEEKIQPTLLLEPAIVLET